MDGLKISIEGVEETITELEKRFSPSALCKMEDRALTSGAQVIKRNLEQSFESFRDTGASIKEITISKPMTLNDVRTVVIYWSGPRKRYTIVHLNEFGTIHNPNPRGKGAIERALRAGQNEYFRVLKEEIVEAI